MAGGYNIVTKDSISVLISTSIEEKCIPIEKHFKKDITVKDLKDKLEVITGASSATMIVKVYNDDKLVCSLDADDKLIGSFHIDDGMRLHVEDNFALRKSLEDESNAEKYNMPLEEYSQRTENRADGILPKASVSKSRGRGLVRNNGCPKDSIDLVKALETKKLRRPQINTAGKSQPSKMSADNDSKSDSHSSQDSNEYNKCRGSSDNLKFSDASEENNSSILNPNAKEFIPSFARQNSDSNIKKSEIEIVNPETGIPVILTDDAIYGTDSFTDCVRVDNVIQAVSAAALISEDMNPSDIRYEKEVNDVLDSIENLLTNSPGLFSSVISALNDIFLRWVAFDSTLTAVANKIVEQSVNNSCYAYFGAKFCTALDKITSSIMKQPCFRTFVLAKCEKLFDGLEELIASDNYARGHNIIMFFAELFIQLDVKGKCRILSLCRGLINSLMLLLSHPTPANISCLCKILKLSGWALDEDQPVLMQQLIKELIELKTVSTLDTSILNVLNSILNLASLSWGRSSNNNSTGAVTPTTPVMGDVFLEPNYIKTMGNTYGPDGEVMTEEESKFLHDNCKFNEEDSDEFGNYVDGEISDESDEICEAYEEFLLSLPDINSCKIVNHIRK